MGVCKFNVPKYEKRKVINFIFLLSEDEVGTATFEKTVEPPGQCYEWVESVG